MPERATVLIVDDELSNIELMNAALEEDYEICFATSGDQALELACSVVPDLILLDVLMPGIDGYEVCLRLKRERLLADVPVIFTTGLHDQEAEVRGLTVGAIDYVTKPINPVVLRARVANHIELKRLRDQLAQMAVTDALTGLSNRRRLESELTSEIQRLAPSGSWLSVLMLDIDFFKIFNDTFGHPEGDRCITMVAAALTRAVRKLSGIPARYGGEEFACILPETDSRTALAVAEDIQKQLRALNIPHPGSPVSDNVTISIGVAAAKAQPGMQGALWLEYADHQLYISKKNGRNQINAVEFEAPPSNPDLFS